MSRLFVVALCVVAGCDGSGAGPGTDAGPGSGTGPVGTFSCASGFPGTDGGASTPAVCIDVSGGTGQDLASSQQQCAQQRGTFATAPCPREGAVGGCRQTRGSVASTTWYYAVAGSTASDIQMLCDGLARVGLPGVTIQFVMP